MAPTVSPVILRSLYRSLWRATKPFTHPSPTAVPYNCLLDRTGIDDHAGWLMKRQETETKATSEHSFSDDEYDQDYEKSSVLVKEIFRRLLREVVNPSLKGTLQMRFPSHLLIDEASNSSDNQDSCGAIRRILRREYRCGTDALASHLYANERQELAFLALRKINAKLAWMDDMLHKAQAASDKKPAALPRVKHVTPIPTKPASNFLQPGTYLIAHPTLTGYFRRTVICILDHCQKAHPGRSTGTYGLIINRPCIKDNRVMTFSEALDPLPDEVYHAFGQRKVRDGGPVHAVLQMLHRPSDSEHDLDIGGHFLPLHPDADKEIENVTIKYKGDIKRASAAVMSGHALASDFSFFVGASTWAIGQLESEIARGYWLPCSAPVSLALDPCNDSSIKAMDEVYVQILAACDRNEALLANLIRYDTQENHPFRKASDEDL